MDADVSGGYNILTGFVGVVGVQYRFKWEWHNYQPVEWFERGALSAFQFGAYNVVILWQLEWLWWCWMCWKLVDIMMLPIQEILIYLQFEWGSLQASVRCTDCTQATMELYIHQPKSPKKWRSDRSLRFVSWLFCMINRSIVYSLYFIISISHIQTRRISIKSSKYGISAFTHLLLFYISWVAPLAPVLSSHEQELGSLRSPIA